MLMPQRTKYRKSHRGRMKGKSQRGNTVAFGDFGLQAVESGKITSRQLEAARRVMSRMLKRGGKIWIRVFPDHPETKKPAETRMGKGKGNPEYWVFRTLPGRIIFEIGGVPEEMARDAFRMAGFKLPLKTRVLNREVI